MRHHPGYQITLVSSKYLTNEQLEHVAETIENMVAGSEVVSVVHLETMTRSRVKIGS